MSKPGKVLRTLCKKLGVRLTVKRGKKRVYKSVKVLKTQCAKKKKKVKRKRRGRKFGASLAGESNEEERDDIRNQVNAALILQALQRESQALLQRERQALRRERILARRQAWRKNNRAKEAARGRDYYKRNKEEIAVRKKARYQKNKEKIAAKRKARIAAEKAKEENDLKLFKHY